MKKQFFIVGSAFFLSCPIFSQKPKGVALEPQAASAHYFQQIEGQEGMPASSLQLQQNIIPSAPLFSQLEGAVQSAVGCPNAPGGPQINIQAPLNVQAPLEVAVEAAGVMQLAAAAAASEFLSAKGYQAIVQRNVANPTPAAVGAQAAATRTTLAPTVPAAAKVAKVVQPAPAGLHIAGGGLSTKDQKGAIEVRVVNPTPAVGAQAAATPTTLASVASTSMKNLELMPKDPERTKIFNEAIPLLSILHKTNLDINKIFSTVNDSSKNRISKEIDSFSRYVFDALCNYPEDINGRIADRDRLFNLLQAVYRQADSDEIQALEDQAIKKNKLSITKTNQVIIIKYDIDNSFFEFRVGFHNFAELEYVYVTAKDIREKKFSQIYSSGSCTFGDNSEYTLSWRCFRKEEQRSCSIQ